MSILGIVLICTVSVFALALLIIFIKSRRPLIFAFINALLGVIAIVAVNMTARFTGVFVPVNVYSVPFSAVFGLPAVATNIILQIALI